MRLLLHSLFAGKFWQFYSKQRWFLSLHLITILCNSHWDALAKCPAQQKPGRLFCSPSSSSLPLKRHSATLSQHPGKVNVPTDQKTPRVEQYFFPRKHALNSEHLLEICPMAAWRCCWVYWQMLLPCCSRRIRCFKGLLSSPALTLRPQLRCFWQGRTVHKAFSATMPAYRLSSFFSPSSLSFPISLVTNPGQLHFSTSSPERPWEKTLLFFILSRYNRRKILSLCYLLSLSASQPDHSQMCKHYVPLLRMGLPCVSS